MLLGHQRRKKKTIDLTQQTGPFVSFVKFFATAGWAGYCPVAPGTAGSLVGMLLWYLWGRLNARPFSWLLLFLSIYFFGVWVSSHARRVFCEAEHNLIVIDEMLGFMIAASFLPPGYYRNEGRLLFAIFFVYRLLNILKPFPLGKLEALPGGWGVMTDDICSGVMTLLIFYLPLEPFWVVQLSLTPAIVPK